MMEPILDEFAAVVAEIPLHAAHIPIASNLTGTVETEVFADPGYWVRHLREKVRFADGIAAARAVGGAQFVEVGPDAALTPMISRIVGEEAAVIPTQRRGRNQVTGVVRGLAEAHCHGVRVEWEKFYAGTGARAIDLPTYAFQRQRYWPTPATAVGADARGMGLDRVDHPWLSAAVRVADTGETLVTGRLSIAAQPWLTDHVVLGSVLLPGTGLVELAGAAGNLVGCLDVSELALEAPLVFDPDVAVTVQVRVAVPDAAGNRPVTVYSRPDGEFAEDAGWIRHAEGVLSAAAKPNSADAPEMWPPAGAVEISVDGLYEDLAAMGFEYGEGFRGVRSVWRAGDELCCEIELPERAHGRGYGVHPAIFDAAFHAAIAPGARSNSATNVLLPFVFRGVRTFRRDAGRVRVRLRVSDGGVEQLTAWDDTGGVVWSMDRLEVRPADAAALRSGGAADLLLTPIWQPLAPAEAAAGTLKVTVLGAVPADRLAGLEIDGRYAELTDLRAGVAESGSPWPSLVVCAAPEPTTEGGPAAVRAAVAELLHLLQAWFAAPGTAAARLIVLTRNAFGIGDGGSGTRAGAALSGLLRSAQAEYPGRVTSVDLDDQAAPEWPALLSLPEPRLAVRGRAIFAERLTRAETSSGPVEFGDGAVLITGGTGGLGAVLARHLVTAYGVRRLVLASRRGPAAEGLSGLRDELETSGATVDVVAADVSDRAVVHGLIDSIPRLTAVVHAAGVLADGTIETLSTEQLDRVMRPKVDAAWYLDEATRDRDLSAFVLFSSAAPLLGGAGQGNYAAANAVLDELARARRALGLPGTSLAWGLWDPTAGMASAAEPAEFARLARVIRDRLGLHPLTVPEGLALFDAAMAAGAPVVAPVQLDLPGLRAAARVGRLHPMLRGLIGGAPTGAPQASLADDLAGLTERQREIHVLELVRARTAAALGHTGPDAVEPDLPFQDLGFDSLAGIELRNGIAQATGITLPVTVAFDHPTPAAVARYLLDQVAPPPTEEMTDDDLRAALRTAPLEELRRAGIVELLAGLSGGDNAEPAADAAPADLNAIADMDAGQLIEFASRYESEAQS
ncbi:type I polyketide synthase [Nocardia thraciensis]